MLFPKISLSFNQVIKRKAEGENKETRDTHQFRKSAEATASAFRQPNISPSTLHSVHDEQCLR